MLKTRLWMGSLLIVLVIGVLRFDPAPWYPFLLLLALLLAAGGSVELYQLIGAAHGLSVWLGGASVLLVLLVKDVGGLADLDCHPQVERLHRPVRVVTEILSVATG